MWIDTHCHLDAPDFGLAHGAGLIARQLARERGVSQCVFPAVAVANFDAVRQLAHQTGDAYALGIHPLYVPHATEGDLLTLEQQLSRHQNDSRLVAVGEIGLDFFVPELCTPEMRERQVRFYRAQLDLAQRFGLPVILHVRRSADVLLQGLRDLARQGRPVAGGIAHAFNGSVQQAQAFMGLGFKLGFGGTLTYDAARRLRQLAVTLPLEAMVLETDAPDMPPQWLYVNAAARASGQRQGVNSPAELPRIAAVLAELRGVPLETLAQATTANARSVLPRLQLLVRSTHARAV